MNKAERILLLVLCGLVFITAYLVMDLRREVEDLKKKIGKGGAAAAAAANPSTVDVSFSLDGQPSKGDAAAKVTIVEFSDYECPFSRRHATDAFAQIDKNYVATGKVRYVYRDYPLPFHKNAATAAAAARCAGEQGKYWQMHDLLFKTPESLTDLVGHAYTIGLDAAKFTECLNSGKYDAPIQAEIAAAGKAGVGSTPSFLLGYTDVATQTFKGTRLISGAESYALFQKTIDSLLAERR